MADDINKKISIDVDINTGGQQQINQYKASFENLRNSINALDKDLAGFTDSVNKLNTQNKSISDSGNKVKDTVTNLSSSFIAVKNVVELATTSFESLQGALTGGLSILIAFAPEFIKWIGNMVKGTTTLSAFNKILQDSKTIMTSMNQVLAKGRLDSQQDYANITLLYETAKNKKLLAEQRLKAVKDLKEQYPGYFGQLSNEVILNGKAEKSYKQLTEAIKKSNQAKELKNKFAQNGDDRVKIEEQTRSENDNLKSLTGQRTAIEAELQKFKRLNPDFHANSDSNNPIQKQANNIYTRLNSINDKIKSSTATIEDLNHQYAVLIRSSKLIIDTYEDFQKNSGPAIEKLGQSNEQLASTTGATNSKVKVSNTPAVRRGPTILGPASSIDASQIDDQTGFVNTTIAADNNIASKPDPELIARLAKAKEAAQQLKDFEIQTAQQTSTAAFGILQNSIKQQSDAKIASLESQKNAELSNTSLTSSQKLIIEQKYKKKEDQEKLKAFNQEKEASLAQAVINGALAITKVASQAGLASPFVIPGIIAETAIQVATIVAQKPPAYATGGLHYTSDGKGGMLPGYSRTDNTNAYLRSGEGIVVSEAMRDPWARNLVSAINVGFGGCDFSTTATGRGFAVGGIFTDGGDANRYYNAPVNDQKNLANSIAYQMVNNFPPVYVDVKDINNQQNILAQTINRVNL